MVSSSAEMAGGDGGSRTLAGSAAEIGMLAELTTQATEGMASSIGEIQEGTK